MKQCAAFSGAAVGEYTLLALVAAVGVVGVEVLWLRTGLLRRPAYVVTMVIMFVGQVVVDGWLTKLSAPIVLYDEERTIGVRFPWDIPVEDFLFGFALLTLVLLLWERAGSSAR
jgi:lycopene cyclase domain-containing protein